MLIKRVVLDRIAAGEITLQFRRQRRPTVKTGGTLRTQIGMLAIGAVEAVSESEITAADARAAGYATKAELLAEFAAREGTIYRVGVSPGGVDPRVTLRENPDVTDDDLTSLRTRLDGYDRRSAAGPWTRATLRLITENPRRRAQDLADEIGFGKKEFKGNVTKLKGLGLTISHSPGYELSPRGRTVYSRLGEDA